MDGLLSLIGLKFADAATETAFRKDFAHAVLPIQRAALIIALIVMLLFTARDIQLAETYGATPLFFRLFVVVPIFSLSLVLTFTEFAITRHQAFFFTVACLIVVAILTQFFLTPPKGAFDARFGFRTMSTMLLLVGIVALSGLRFQYSIPCGVFIIAGWLYNAYYIDLDRALWGPTLLHLTAMLLLASCVNYWLERSLRLQFAARRALDAERSRANELLFATIPAHAAERLKGGEQQIADAFVEAVAVFADIAGFTDLSKRIGPKETVHVLNRIFTAFDEIAARRGLERVKTMGDGYFLIGGTNLAQESVIDEAAGATLEMLAVVEKAAEEFQLPLALRVGMHAGPVVGGVIGRQKITYDYWGDTLNIASRLETTAESGRVLVSETVYWRLGKAWTFEPRGMIELKGYSTVQTYYLVGPARR